MGGWCWFVCSVSVNSLLAWTGQSSRVVSSPGAVFEGSRWSEVREAKKKNRVGFDEFFLSRRWRVGKHIIFVWLGMARLKLGGDGQARDWMKSSSLVEFRDCLATWSGEGFEFDRWLGTRSAKMGRSFEWGMSKLPSWLASKSLRLLWFTAGLCWDFDSIWVFPELEWVWSRVR